MKYDSEDRAYYFSTQMIPSQEDTDASFEHFKAYQQMCLDNPGTWVKDMTLPLYKYKGTSLLIHQRPSSLVKWP